MNRCKTRIKTQGSIRLAGGSGAVAASDSLPASDAGPTTTFRIFVGAFVGCISDTIESARDGAEDIPAEARGAFAFPAFPSAGADVADLGMEILSPSTSFPDTNVTAAANSESLSPTHARVNQRPPAIPLISRFATLHRRTLVPVRSSGNMGANPVLILGGGWTGNGFDGRG